MLTYRGINIVFSSDELVRILTRISVLYPNGAFVYPDEPIILRVHVEKHVSTPLPEVRFIEVPVAVVPDSPEEQAERAAQAEVDAVLAQVQP